MTQTNIVVVTEVPGVVVSAGTGHDAPQLPAGPSPVDASGETAGSIAAPELRMELLPSPAPPVTVEPLDGGVEELPPAVEAEVAPSHGPMRFVPGRSFRKTMRPALGGARIAPWTLRQQTKDLVIRQTPSVTTVTSGSSRVSHDGSRAHTKAVERASRWRPPAPKDIGIRRVSSGATITPAGPGASSSGGLPLVLALPFLAAVLDMAWRIALDRVATPSGHRSRAPHDPG